MSTTWYDTANEGGNAYGAGAGMAMPQHQQGSRRLHDPIQVSWSTAFGTGGFDDEPPLSEELGINLEHIRKKAMVVLNPRKVLEAEVLNDDDLAGPLLFCLTFGAMLLLAGKFHFGYIYGLALVGCIALYFLLNLMSPTGLDGYRTASVLGYCLLPMVLLSVIQVIVPIDSGVFSFVVALLTVGWCTFSASSMFVTVLGMHNQRALVAYPVSLFYTCFALMSIF